MPTDDGQAKPDGGAGNGDGTQSAEAARNAEAEANRNKLLAELEQKAARVNAAEAEAARLKAENEALKRPPSPAAGSAGDDPRAARLERVRAYAEGTADPNLGKDEVAGAVLDLMQELEMTQRELGNLHRLGKINDEEVEQEFQKNRNLYGTPEVARQVVEGRRAAEREKKANEEAERLRAALAASQNRLDPNHVRTHAPTEITAVELKSRMTDAEWKERQRALAEVRDAGGQGWEDADRQLRSEQRQVRERKVVIDR